MARVLDFNEYKHNNEVKCIKEDKELKKDKLKPKDDIDIILKDPFEDSIDDVLNQPPEHIIDVNNMDNYQLLDLIEAILAITDELDSLEYDDRIELNFKDIVDELPKYGYDEIKTMDDLEEFLEQLNNTDK
jgi:hypothetical protein